jgi:hypothetical protein
VLKFLEWGKNMAVKKEFHKKRKDGVNLYRTYSDANMKILQNETGKEYIEAIDVEDAPFTYSETETPIDTKDEATEADYQNALENLGVNFDE